MSKRAAPFAICGGCMGPIDLPAVQEALRRGERFAHECGRVLVAGSSEAA